MGLDLGDILRSGKEIVFGSKIKGIEIIAKEIGGDVGETVEKIVGSKKAKEVIDIIHNSGRKLSENPDFLQKLEEFELQKTLAHYDLLKEIEGVDSYKWINGIRHMMRPTITIWLTMVLPILLAIFPDSVLDAFVKMPGSLWTLITVVVGFWFGGREIRKILGTYMAGRFTD